MRLLPGLIALLSLGGASAGPLRRAGQPAAEAAEALGATISHVLVLKKPDGVELSLEAMIGVLTSVGVAREQASPILEKLEAEGEVIVAQGARESLEKLGQAFGETGVQALVQSIAELQAEAAAKVSDYIGSDVQELSLDSLSEWLQEDEGVLIIFYGHACSHCKAMAPALQEAATQLRQSGVRVGAINLQATPAAEEIAQALHLRGLPTVRYVMNGNHLEYGGDRSAASLVAFATKAKGMAPDAGAQQIADAAREAAGEAEAAAGGATETGSEAAVGGATETGAAVEAASAAEEEDGSLEAPDAEGAAAAIDVEGATAAAADSLAAESKVEASPAAAVEKAALPHEAAGAAATGAEAPGAAAAGAEAPESKVHKSKLAKSNKAPAAAAA